MIESLAIWERLNNPDSTPFESDGFREQAGLNRQMQAFPAYQGVKPLK